MVGSEDEKEVGEEVEEEYTPGLEVLYAAQQINVTGRILLNDILDVVGTERLSELSSGNKVLDFPQGPNGVLVLLREHTELCLLLVLVLICGVRKTSGGVQSRQVSFSSRLWKVSGAKVKQSEGKRS